MVTPSNTGAAAFHHLPSCLQGTLGAGTFPPTAHRTWHPLRTRWRVPWSSVPRAAQPRRCRSPTDLVADVSDVRLRFKSWPWGWVAVGLAVVCRRAACVGVADMLHMPIPPHTHQKHTYACTPRHLDTFSPTTLTHHTSTSAFLPRRSRSPCGPPADRVQSPRLCVSGAATAAMLPPGVTTRGPCRRCGAAVTTDQLRSKGTDGIYSHDHCPPGVGFSGSLRCHPHHPAMLHQDPMCVPTISQ